jgi:hypothetical protein
MSPRPLLAAALSALCLHGLSAAPALAEVTGDGAVLPAAGLAQVLRLEELFAAVAEEGAQGGRDIDEGLLGRAGGPGWAAAVARIYDPAVLRPAFEAALAEALAVRPGGEEAALAFFGSELGQRILGLEIAARRALLDDPQREAAEVAAERMGEARDPRLRQIRRLVETTDMIELGTTATLSAYLAFQEGMAETAPAGLAPRPEDLPAQVYALEAQIRADTATWVISYMTLAYSPLTEAEVDAYIAFFDSEAGRDVNAALATAFEATLTPVSRDLGRAAGRSLAGRDI